MSPSLFFALVYATALIAVGALVYSFYYHSRKMAISINLERVLSLGREEFARLFKKDAVFIMHGSIVAGVALSILITIMDPFTDILYQFRTAILIISIPITLGLVGALVWRIDRFVQSIKVQKQMSVDKKFWSASLRLQTWLIVVIALAITQFILEWFQNMMILATGLDAIKSMLVAVYYVGPSLNLLTNFDRPISKITTPFYLKDVVEGRVDAGSIKQGVSVLGEFQKYETNSFESCVEIGACEATCPATSVGRRLSPRILVRKLELLRASEGLSANAFLSIEEEELWACTTCAACVESCPVGVRHVDIIVDLRRSLVAEGKLDKKKSDLLLNMSQQRNSLGISNSGRNYRLRDIGVKTVAENPNFEYLLWVGCMSSFDENAKSSIHSLVSLLKRAGVLDKFAILGEEETCCGDPARRLGEEGLFQEFALYNIEIFKRYKVSKMVLTCPHGCNVFSNDYMELDPWMKNVTILHQTQFIADLHKHGKIMFANDEKTNLTIHDPCYLTRYMKVTKQQRKLLRNVGKVLEAERHGEKTFCCGAGGANYWYEVPERKRISHKRFEQLSHQEPDTIVTLCPFCKAMLKDAATIKGTKTTIKDIAEVLNENLSER